MKYVSKNGSSLEIGAPFLFGLAAIVLVGKWIFTSRKDEESEEK